METLLADHTIADEKNDNTGSVTTARTAGRRGGNEKAVRSLSGESSRSRWPRRPLRAARSAARSSLVLRTHFAIITAGIDEIVTRDASA
jgi:hypothetical protein